MWYIGKNNPMSQISMFHEDLLEFQLDKSFPNICNKVTLVRALTVLFSLKVFVMETFLLLHNKH